MNAPFLRTVSALDTDFALLAYAWRGACLELYSEVERAVSKTLEAVATEGNVSTAESHHHAAGVRLRALLQALRSGSFSGHEARAVALLERWETLDKHRIYFAHGQSRVGDRVIIFTIEPRVLRAEQPAARKEYDLFAMLELITELHEYTQRLRQQLGQIKAACRRRLNP